MTDLPATAVEVTDHVTHVFLGRDGFDVHDRLQHDRACLARGFLESEAACHLERDFRAVHFMKGAVDDLDLDIHHRIATQYTGLRGFDDSVFDRANKFPRDRAAHDFVLDHDAA